LRAWLWVLLGVSAAVVGWTYMHQIFLPWEHYVDIEHGKLKAGMGDLYPRWIGTRELLLHRRNPYGPEVSQEIQTAFYGHPLQQRYDGSSEILDEQRFVYPIYVVFLLAPTVHTDFGQLQMWTPIVLGGLIALSVLLWIRFLRWSLPWPAVFAIILLVLSSPQAALGLRLRQIGFFVVALTAIASWFVFRGRLLPAGVLLAISTIKPQMVALCLLWFFVWSLGDWKRRRALVIGFAVTLGVLIAAGELLLPRWPHYFLEGLDAYRKYFPTTSPLRLLLGDWFGGILSGLLVIALLLFAWSNRKVEAESSEFARTLALFFIASTLVLPLLTPYNHALLLLPLLMLVRNWSSLPLYGRYAFVTVLAWPFFASIFLFLYGPNLHSFGHMPQLPAALVLLVPFLVAWLIFVRRPDYSSRDAVRAIPSTSIS
jgi:glycosyl transferase family 87